MEKILQDILKELRLHTSLLESFCQGKKESKDIQKNIKAQMDLSKKMMMSMPGFKANPEAMKMIENIFNTIPGGSE